MWKLLTYRLGVCAPATPSPQQPNMKGLTEHNSNKPAFIRHQARCCLITGSERARKLDQPICALAEAPGGLEDLQSLFSNDASLRNLGLEGNVIA